MEKIARYVASYVKKIQSVHRQEMKAVEAELDAVVASL